MKTKVQFFVSCWCCDVDDVLGRGGDDDVVTVVGTTQSVMLSVDPYAVM